MDISIITAIIGAATAFSGMILGWMAKAKEMKQEARADAEAEAVIKTDMDYIKRGVDDIRLEQKVQGQRIDVLSERVTRLEESTKQAHKRLDHLEQKGVD